MTRIPVWPRIPGSALRIGRKRTAGGALPWLALLLLLAPTPVGSAAPPPSGPVHVDQIGYRPGDPKWVAVGAPAAAFEVRRVLDDAIVHSGALALRRSADPGSGDTVHSGDFSLVTTAGEYYIHVPGLGDSPRFLVHDAVYDDLFRKLLKGLYYQRCGTAIPGAFGGFWTHGSCHDHGGAVASFDWSTTGGAPGGYRNTIGGWHDAGDYGKYSTNNGYAVGVLLQGYERDRARFAYDDCAIPESGNGVPDLLDEARWSLAWMFSMQDADGGVHHRESGATYQGMFPPESDAQTRYHTSLSSDATAVQCAALALAARVYLPFDAPFAAACSTRAVMAWGWLLAHPTRVPTGGFVNLFGHTGATYIAGSEVGRRLWAAAEIHRLNGDTTARGYVDAHWGETLDFNGVWYPDGWGDVANMGAYTYHDTPGATPAVVSGQWWSIRNSLLSSAAGWRTRVNQDGYGCAAATAGSFGDYYWGFTGVLLRYAWILLEGERHGGGAALREAAREQLHYILGRNPLGKVYVTGLGSRPVLHSHGAWNTAAAYTGVDDAACRPVPFLLVGGPNKADNGTLSPWPGRCYEDIADPDYNNLGNYTLNETSVNIQASLIVLAGLFGTGGAATGVPDPGPEHSVGTMTARPNPFAGGVTRLRWTPAAGTPEQAVEIFDVNGRWILGLAGVPVDGGLLEAAWDGRTAGGAPAPAGVYFARARGASGAGVRVVFLGNRTAAAE